MNKILLTVLILLLIAIVTLWRYKDQIRLLVDKAAKIIRDFWNKKQIEFTLVSGNITSWVLAVTSWIVWSTFLTFLLLMIARILTWVIIERWLGYDWEPRLIFIWGGIPGLLLMLWSNLSIITKMKKVEVPEAQTGLPTMGGRAIEDAIYTPGTYLLPNWGFASSFQLGITAYVTDKFPLDFDFEVIAKRTRVKITLSLLVHYRSNELFKVHRKELSLKGKTPEQSGIYGHLYDTLAPLIQSAANSTNFDEFRTRTNVNGAGFRYSKFEEQLWKDMENINEFQLNPGNSSLEVDGWGLDIPALLVKNTFDASGEVTKANEGLVTAAKKKELQKIKTEIFSKSMKDLRKVFPDKTMIPDNELYRGIMVMMDEFEREIFIDPAGLSGPAALTNAIGAVVSNVSKQLRQ